MGQTITDIRHRLKRLNEAEPGQMALKLGDMDCEFVLEAYDKAIEALKKIEAHLCICSIDDEIIPQCVARDVLKKLGEIK